MRKTSLPFMLISLTVLCVLAQLVFFGVQYHVSDLLDSLVKTPILKALITPIVFYSLITYLGLQATAYIILISWIFFITNNVAKLSRIGSKPYYLLGIFFWLITALFIVSLNSYYYPHSFFAIDFHPKILLIFSAAVLGAAGLAAYYYFFRCNKKNIFGWLFLLFFIFLIVTAFYQGYFLRLNFKAHPSKPNIIIIGIDSLRPDSIDKINTPYLYQLLSTSSIYKNAYTPLARTFPSWISLLRAAYPKHTSARANLAQLNNELQQATLATRLRDAGYETIYGTDESRYTDITQQEGFSHILSDKIVAVEFLLGSLYDFPINNLLLRIPGLRELFPYNFANRAADITYYPDDFLNFLKVKLAPHQQKPVLLALHLTLSHWPFTWANSNGSENSLFPLYKKSLQAVDQQFKKLHGLLKKSGMLDHAILVLVSDHGVTLGELNDRWIEKSNYYGPKKDLHLITRYRLAGTPANSLDSHNFVMNTSYGQGTDVLSLPQYHVLLAFKTYQTSLPLQNFSQLSSLMDIAPTLLDYLRLPPLQVDGNSLLHHGGAVKHFQGQDKPFFIETADVIDGMETDKIDVNRVAKNAMTVYQVNPATGAINFKPKAISSLLKRKQRAVIWHDWLLAYYPDNTQIIGDKKLPKHFKLHFNLSKRQYKLETGSSIVPLQFKLTKNKPYFVLLNLKTRQWTINFNNDFAQRAPSAFLLEQLKLFYRDEISP